MSSKSVGKKPRVEVVFDPNARKEYLTGFHKRKMARRRFGLAMQEIKDRKGRLEERKERREVLRERREELGVADDLNAYDIKARAREQSKAKTDEVVCVDFDDGHTQEMFGDSVTVTTVEGIPDSDDEEAFEAERLEKELIAEKKRSRAEHSSIRRRCGTKGAPIAGGREGETENRWSLAAVQKRLAANMPAKTRKGATGRANGGTGVSGSEKGKKGSKHRKALAGRTGGGAAGASASALMDKARGSMPRAELGKSKGKKRKRG